MTNWDVGMRCRCLVVIRWSDEYCVLLQCCLGSMTSTTVATWRER